MDFEFSLYLSRFSDSCWKCCVRAQKQSYIIIYYCQFMYHKTIYKVTISSIYSAFCYYILIFIHKHFLLIYQHSSVYILIFRINLDVIVVVFLLLLISHPIYLFFMQCNLCVCIHMIHWRHARYLSTLLWLYIIIYKLELFPIFSFESNSNTKSKKEKRKECLSSF